MRSLFQKNAPFAAVSVSIVLTGCATATAPADLRSPQQVTCIHVAQPLRSADKYGLLDVEWEVQLAAGVYVSEKEDEQGVYYRAPAGGVYVGRTDSRDKPANLGTHMTYDGGIWIPRDPHGTPRLYQYFTMRSAAVVSQPEGIDCAAVTYVRDPEGVKLSVLSYAGAGALGGAVGRAVVPSSGVSYGQAALGGAIGFGIAAYLVNRDVGKIVPGMDLKNQEFIETLRKLGTQAVPVKEASVSSPK